ncbi:LPS O-antigen length regulator [Marinobacter maroccanus]|uniref:LPS O-antigen length regulator n=1 Tax=Marinobacter maroccanus TaxID=2055143 RepID=A0A2S5ZFL9_9GAMM|nr:Wzz/FepE/Etk N-terminal domain-containing protein [Marinobacter maroccanus]PPI86004.1 LPS O-antigen length regulator [Marinobacter maroccanus]
MNQGTEQQHYPDDEIDLRDLFLTLWRGKWIVILTTIVFAAAGVGYALNKPNIYKTSVLVAPAQEDGGLSGLAGQFGGLASLAGINLGGGGSNQIVIAKEVMQSRAFLTGFFQRHDMEIPLMAVEGWNEKTGDWVYDRDKYNPETGEWLPYSDGETHKPTDWEMVEVFREDHFGVSENKDTGMITVSVQHYSPILAKEWAEKLMEDINEYMRKQDVEEAEARIEYLEEKLNEITIAGMQQVFYQLIESETRTVMLANAQKEYVFKTIDPAVIPEEKSEPKRALMTIGATAFGLMLGVCIVLVRAFIGNGQQEEGCA